MPTVTSQRHAWRWTTSCAIELTALVACLAMALTLAPAHADEGNVVM